MSYRVWCLVWFGFSIFGSIIKSNAVFCAWVLWLHYYPSSPFNLMICKQKRRHHCLRTYNTFFPTSSGVPMPSRNITVLIRPARPQNDPWHIRIDIRERGLVASQNLREKPTLKPIKEYPQWLKNQKYLNKYNNKNKKK